MVSVYVTFTCFIPMERPFKKANGIYIIYVLDLKKDITVSILGRHHQNGPYVLLSILKDRVTGSA